MCLQGSPDNDKELSLILIKSMIASNPSDRPPAMAVYNHPNFWDHLQILTFFQVRVNLIRFLPNRIKDV